MHNIAALWKSLPQGAVKARGTEGLKRGLDKFREDRAIGDRQPLCSSCSSQLRKSPNHGSWGAEEAHQGGLLALVLFPLLLALSICYWPLLEAGYGVG